MREPPCRVILNDRCLRNPQTGVGRYVVELLDGLGRAAPEIEILPFYSWLRGGRPAGSRGADPGSPGRVGTPPARPRRPATWLRRAAQQVYDAAFEIIGTSRGYGLYHEPNHIPMPWHGPIVTTIHDLSVVRHPEWHPADRVDWYQREFEAGLARTHHFITVSNFTRDEMVSLLGIPAERITPIPLGIGPAFRPPDREDGPAGLPGSSLPPCLLYVGTLEPRKNVPGLLAAYASLPASLRQRVPLVIAGMSGWGQEDVRQLAVRLGVIEQVFTLGYVSEEQLRALYHAAHALVWPTLYEGFGLPPLEAMACGTPVITSNAASLPEVVGDAAVLIDPLVPEQIAEAMRRLIEDEALRATLSARGLARTRQFSWDRCAQAHATVYRAVAGG